jgi:ribonuclease E
VPVLPEAREAVKATLATIAAAAAHAHEHEHDHDAPAVTDQEAPVLEVSEMETEQVVPPAPAFDVFAELAVTHPGGAAAATPLERSAWFGIGVASGARPCLYSSTST